MNICKEICPIFSGQCAPSECDIIKNRISELYEENSKLRDRISRLRLDNEIIKNQLSGNFSIIFDLRQNESKLKIENENLKKEIDGHLKYISELHDRYDDVTGR